MVSAVAFVVKAGALLIARNGVTVRPLNESNLRLKTCLVCRADDDSKIDLAGPVAAGTSHDPIRDRFHIQLREIDDLTAVWQT
jgi:hypothetical protein